MNELSRIGGENVSVEELAEAVTYGVEAFVSKEYLEDEKEKLWPKVWQMADRVEILKKPGDFFTYDILDDSIIVIRTGPEPTDLKAFHNVCPHRGRQLVDVEPGVHSVTGSRNRFVCGFHGWTFNRDGENTYLLDQDDWKGALNPDCTSLTPVKVDTWGGWIFVNMDPNSESLTDYLGDVVRVLGPFQFEKMRYKWRNWVVYDSNWKTALEAFMEPYHVAGTHPQFLKYGDYYAYSAAYGLHGVSGFDVRGDEVLKKAAGSSITRAGRGLDPRVSTYELVRENYETVNFASATETLVAAAKRLVDEVPEGTPTDKIIQHWLASAKKDDLARGIVWPELTNEQMTEAGLAWHVFPNMSILQGVTFALCYRARPYGDDPNKCIFESYAIERFPDGEVPETEWNYAETTPENWGAVLCQDFSNMAAVQRGMKSRGFKGTLPNPHQERKVTNFHRNLHQYMGRGGPTLFKPEG